MTMVYRATVGLLLGSALLLVGCAAKQEPAPIDPAVMARIEAAANKAEMAANKAVLVRAAIIFGSIALPSVAAYLASDASCMALIVAPVMNANVTVPKVPATYALNAQMNALGPFVSSIQYTMRTSAKSWTCVKPRRASRLA